MSRSNRPRSLYSLDRKLPPANGACQRIALARADGSDTRFVSIQALANGCVSTLDLMMGDVGARGLTGH